MDISLANKGTTMRLDSYIVHVVESTCPQQVGMLVRNATCLRGTHPPRCGVVDVPSWSRHTTRNCNIHDPCITPNTLRCRRVIRPLRQRLLQNPHLLHHQAGRFRKCGFLGLRSHPEFKVGQEKIDIFHSYVHRLMWAAAAEQNRG